MTASASIGTRPGRWSHELQAGLAVARRTALVELRYRNKFAMDLIGHLIGLAPIVLTAWALSGGRHSNRLTELAGLPDPFTFVLLGFVAFSSIGLGSILMLYTGAWSNVGWEQTNGVFERNMLAPVRRGTILFGISGYFTTLFAYHAVTLFLFGWLIFGLQPEVTWTGLGLGIVALLCLLVTSCSLGVIGASLTLGFKEEELYLLIVSRPMTVLSGAYFLIELVPQPFRALAMVNPLAYAIDAFRGALTGHPLLVPNNGVAIGAAIAVAAGMSILAIPVHRRMTHRMVQKGTLGLF